MIERIEPQPVAFQERAGETLWGWSDTEPINEDTWRVKWWGDRSNLMSERLGGRVERINGAWTVERSDK